MDSGSDRRLELGGIRQGYRLIKAVITPGANGKLTCQAEGVRPPPGDEAVILNYENTGYLCGTDAGVAWNPSCCGSSAPYPGSNKRHRVIIRCRLCLAEGMIAAT